MPVPEPVESRLPFEALVEALARPEAWGREAGPVEVCRTHISVVFLVGDRAYKLKRPIRLWGFLDYGTPEMRRRWCEEEVRLNRRLAPAIYLGVVPIVRGPDGVPRRGGEGEVLDHAVEMVRIAPGATLKERLAAGAVKEEEVARVAETLAGFHAGARLAPEAAGLARPSAFGAIVLQNVRATRAAVGDLFPERVHEGLVHRLAARLAAGRERIRRRLREGRMVDGHGDVRLEHVVRFQGRTCVIDCVEFTPRLRHVDPLSDAAFLAMDLQGQGRPDLARAFLARYVESAGEPPEDADALLPLYLAYRAHVRAKVDAQTVRTPEVDDALRAQKALGARRHLALAWSLARRGEPAPVVLLHGVSGAGKSRLAGALAPWLDAEVLRSDVLRKEIAGLAPTERVAGARKQVLYGAAMSERTYDRMLARGIETARAGHPVLLDATWLLARGRRTAHEAARRHGLPFAVLSLSCPEAVLEARLRHRMAAGTDASDADVEVYRAQRDEVEPPGDDEAPWTLAVGHEERPEAVALRLADLLERQGGSA